MNRQKPMLKEIVRFLSLYHVAVEKRGGRETRSLVKLYTKRSARSLFYNFSNINLYTRHTEVELSDKPINWILKVKDVNRVIQWGFFKWGCYLIIEATK